MRSAERGQRGVALAAALVAVTFVAISTAPSITAGAQPPTQAGAAVVPDSADPVPGELLGSLVATPASWVSVSPSVQRFGRNIAMACPTTAKPRCALWFVQNDAGWRVHPVYGYHSCHTGIDLRGSYGTPIHAAAAGRVIRVIHGDRAYGTITLIQDNRTIRTMYAHQSRVLVHPGQRVRVGQLIGRVGATGFATGPHLHFEIHVDRRPYDPDGWFGSTKHPVGCFPGRKY